MITKADIKQMYEAVSAVRDRLWECYPLPDRSVEQSCVTCAMRWLSAALTNLRILADHWEDA